jgi:predicted nucleic-acid-binding protein
MRAADTNVLVRLVVRDDLEQIRTAESSTASGSWVSHLVLAEAMWVLDAVYDRTPEQIATAVDMLLNHKDLTIQNAEVVANALEQFRKRPHWDFPIAWRLKSRVSLDTCRWGHLIAIWQSSMVRSGCNELSDPQ